MLLDELAGLLLYVGGCHLDRLDAEGRHGVVLLSACHRGLAQVGDVALHLDLGIGTGKDGNFGEIGKEEHKGGRVGHGSLEEETAVVHRDGVLRAQLLTVEVELALIKVLEMSFQVEAPVLASTCAEKERGKKAEGYDWGRVVDAGIHSAYLFTSVKYVQSAIT